MSAAENTTTTTMPVPTTEQMRAALADVEYRMEGVDPEITKYLRGVRDTLRTVLGVETDESNPANIIILESL